MKKRTVITTEKREIWVISEGGVTLETTDQPQDGAPSDDTEALRETDQHEPHQPDTEAQE